MDTFRYGSTIVLDTVVYNAAGVPTNPTDLTLTVRAPNGTETSYAFVALTDEAGPGAYSFTLPTNAHSGSWGWRWESTNPDSVDEGDFLISGSAIAGARATGMGPCTPWCDPGNLTQGGWTAPVNATQQIMEQACQAASEVCWELGGRRWPGLCWDSILPQGCAEGPGHPVVIGDGAGGMTAIPSGSARPSRPATTGMVIDLGQANVTAVDAVRVDGVALASSAYRLIDHRWLARIDGDTWSFFNPADATTIALAVDFTYGDAPPAIGVLAAIALARELTRALADADDCTIDPRVTSLIREGVALTLGTEGVTGEFLEVVQVRRFVDAVNPQHLRRAASVIIPGQTSWPSRIG